MGIKKLLSLLFSFLLLYIVSLALTAKAEAASSTSPFAADIIAQAVTIPQGFQDSVVFSGLNNPMTVRFASNGKIFVAEKSGIIKVFDDVNDTTPTIFADLSSEVNSYWDRGLMSLTINPNFATNPYIYVAYTYDAPLGQTAPYWNDNCSDGNGVGCPVRNRVSRLTANGNTMVAGSEKVLVEDWCNQFPSHAIGDLQFGSDSALYVTGGEGASFTYADYGQQSSNPCNDPTNEGGALRAQDLQTPNDPVGLSGTLIRIDPSTGNAFTGNPLIGGARTDDDSILAYGFRNPFRFAIQPTTNDIWVGNVGYNTWEAIDRVQNPTASVKNFGWPCYEGADHTQGYFTLNLPICQTLYGNNSVVPPYYAYIHQGSSAISGLAFYNGNSYPSQYKNALFMADYAGGWLKVMFPNASQQPDTNNILTFLDGVYVADIQVGPNGDIFYVNIGTGEVHRIQYFSTNTPPVAKVTANKTNGPSPLAIQFNASTSFDPDLGDTISYSWDFNGDGVYGESTISNPTYTYTTDGIYNASVRVTDSHGAFNNANITISAGNSPVARITLPETSLTYQVGDTVKFSGEATDSQNNFLPPSALSWKVIIHHCAVSNPSDCHNHFLQTIDGVSAGSISAPDHEYPSYLEFQLTATQQGFPAGWWNSNWLYRRKLAFNTTGITSALTNFPTLVTLNPSNIDYSKTGTNGNDLRFVDKNNNALSYEIEQWNPGGTSTVWVKVPSISATDNYMWMYYGNSTAPAGQNRTAVWSDGYRGVWHLNNSTIDSTSNALNGTSTNSTAATGKIAGGRAFNGTNARIAVNNSSQLLFTNTQSFSIGAWVNYTTKTGTKGVITKSRNVSPGYGLTINTANKWVFLGPTSITGSTVPSGWNYIQLVQNGATNQRIMYVNGVQVATGTAQSGIGTGQLWFGGSNGFNEWFQGSLDEISIAGTFRSTQWVQTNYKSENNTLLTFQAEETKTILTNTKSVSIYPRTTTLSFTSNPIGAHLSVYSEDHVAPFSIQAVVGATVQLSAPSTQTINGVPAQFSSWSDGGSQDHLITALQEGGTYTANYTTNIPADTTIWNSYDAQLLTTGSKAQLNDVTGTKSAVLDLYTSSDDEGVTLGIPFTTYTAEKHPDLFNNLQPFWSNTANGGYPYVGKSLVGRGSDINETNTPSPLGAMDLQIHPPDSAKLTVVAFTAPENGTYTVSGLGVRRIDGTAGQTARFKIFNNSKELIANIQSTNQTWTLDTNSYNLGTLNLGDKVYFAVDSDGSYAWDATEISWRLTKTGVTAQIPPTINSFTAAPTSIQIGQQSTLSWNVTNATSVSINNGVGTVALSGTIPVSPTTTTTYTLTAINSAGSPTQNVIVTVMPIANSPLQWNSSDIVLSGINSNGALKDTTGTVSASILFYQSANIGGIDEGTLFTQYTNVPHTGAFNHLDPFYSFLPGDGYPYAGKSSVGRGNDTNEANTPSPTGVMDLQLHPADNGTYTVAEFVIPKTGTYFIPNLGVRRVDGNPGQSSRLKVYGPQKNLIANLQTTSQAWTVDNTEHSLGQLNQGDKVYFAVDGDGSYAWDATEITWSLKSQN